MHAAVFFLVMGITSTQAGAASPSDAIEQPEAFVPARLLHGAPPEYPAYAVDRELEGFVLLNVHIDKDGRATGVHVDESTGHWVLEYAAISALKTWRFRPAMRGITPVRSNLQVPFHFELAPGRQVLPGGVSWPGYVD